MPELVLVCFLLLRFSFRETARASVSRSKRCICTLSSTRKARPLVRLRATAERTGIHRYTKIPVADHGAAFVYIVAPDWYGPTGVWFCFDTYLCVGAGSNAPARVFEFADFARVCLYLHVAVHSLESEHLEKTSCVCLWSVRAYLCAV